MTLDPATRHVTALRASGDSSMIAGGSRGNTASAAWTASTFPWPRARTTAMSWWAVSCALGSSSPRLRTTPEMTRGRADIRSETTGRSPVWCATSTASSRSSSTPSLEIRAAGCGPMGAHANQARAPGRTRARGWLRGPGAGNHLLATRTTQWPQCAGFSAPVPPC